MTVSSTIKIFFLVVLTWSCNDDRRLDKMNREQAIKNIQLLDSATMELFKTWRYSYRGGETWSKGSGDSIHLICLFDPSEGAQRIETFQLKAFLQYFEVDTTIGNQYKRIEFKKIGDSIRIRDTDANDTTKLRYYPFHKVFPKANPFDTLSNLSALRKKMNVILIANDPKAGGFIQFYLPGGQHVLTYLPDTLLHSEHLDKLLKKELMKGETIAPHWNFRKMERALDQG